MDFTHKIPGINGLAAEHAPETVEDSLPPALITLALTG
jgi:hypothetical protein